MRFFLSTFDRLSQQVVGEIEKLELLKFILCLQDYTLINSVFNTTLLHALNITKLPKKASKRMKKGIRDFLWYKGDWFRGLHLISWGTVSLPK